MSASNRFETVVVFLRKKLGVVDGSVFCYVNSVFAPGLDEGVGALWRVSFSFSFLVLDVRGGAGLWLGSKGGFFSSWDDVGRGGRAGVERWIGLVDACVGCGCGGADRGWIVLQDGRSADCGVFDNAGFWVRHSRFMNDCPAMVFGIAYGFG